MGLAPIDHYARRIFVMTPRHSQRTQRTLQGRTTQRGTRDTGVPQQLSDVVTQRGVVGEPTQLLDLTYVKPDPATRGTAIDLQRTHRHRLRLRRAARAGDHIVNLSHGRSIRVIARQRHPVSVMLHAMAYQSGSRAVQSYMRARPLIQEARGVTDEPVAASPLSIEPIGPSHRVSPARAHEVIDLLNAEPAIVVDVERLRWALSFGFAGGDIGGLLLQAMRKAPVATSDWNPSAFASGLFVSDLIRIGMHVRIGALEPSLDSTFIARVITHPPSERSVIEHRHAIITELASDAALRSHFNDLYRALHHVRELLDSQGPVRELDGRRRRLEVLAGIRDALNLMASGFGTCTSGLSRIHRFAAHVTGTDGFRQLLELLDYENHLAKVDVKVALGSDGRVRHFSVTRVAENSDNRFYRSPIGRWLARIGLFFRGFSIGESEVANHWVDAAFEGVQDALPPMLQLLGEMEVYLASFAFKDAAESRGLKVCLPQLFDVDGANAADARANTTATGFVGLFNPLLFAQTGSITACDLALGSLRATTLVTGPNSGGKTRLLQALALAQMLGQAGLHVPAISASLARTSGLFVSLIEEARADQKEGRLGTELVRIRRLFEEAHPGSLIVLDELCSGTNPSEGEEIIRLVLSLLGELHASVFITTHFLQFATRLADEPSTATGALHFLQVELDAQETPTFRFVPGVAQTSLAHQTAARLGVTRDELMALIDGNRRK